MNHPLRLLQALWLGEVAYRAAWTLQKELVSLRQRGIISDILLLLSHPRTVTLGRRASPSNLLVSREDLSARGFEIFDVDRGGDVTYHGPGQLVGYPILDLRGYGQDLHLYIRNLEEALLRALEPLDIYGCRNPPHTGVWVQNRKIAAIGIKVSRWVTSHGFALNVTTDLADFGFIVPCGIRDNSVTSVAAEAGREVNLLEVIPAVLDGICATFHTEIASGEIAESALSSQSAKILRKAIDASKIGVIDYAPLSGEQSSSVQEAGEN